MLEQNTYILERYRGQALLGTLELLLGHILWPEPIDSGLQICGVHIVGSVNSLQSLTGIVNSYSGFP